MISAKLHISKQHMILLILASAFQAFGMYNIHSPSGITEGGIFGFLLLIQYWLKVSPALSSIVLNGICYLWGWKRLGRSFITKSIIASLAYSLTYALCSMHEPLWPDIVNHPLIACITGALFIGIGAGICVRCGGATCGDDALAMCIHDLTGIAMEKIYLCSDLFVLVLSLSYIPFSRIIFSLITVVISGQIIGYLERIS
ncbi:MAG: YitT family protein [Bulleidia sp.]